MRSEFELVWGSLWPSVCLNTGGNVQWLRKTMKINPLSSHYKHHWYQEPKYVPPRVKLRCQARCEVWRVTWPTTSDVDLHPGRDTRLSHIGPQWDKQAAKPHWFTPDQSRVLHESNAASWGTHGEPVQTQVSEKIPTQHGLNNSATNTAVALTDKLGARNRCLAPGMNLVVKT